MQGRLSPVIEGKIQSFPWQTWRDEFLKACSMQFRLMEWTLDMQNLHQNPIMTDVGRAEIKKLTTSTGVKIMSLTGDCFMQNPFWKKHGLERDKLCREFYEIVQACFECGITILVIPLVDNGGLDNLHQENILVDFLRASENFLLSKKIKIAFESEYSPDNLTNFIDKFNPDLFGINYDIGNSAALGFDPKEELRKYGKRIINVHIKDRKLGGTTVPLGRGNADFVNVFSGLAKICYGGNYILQTARADGDAHAEALSTYREQVKKWMPNYAS